MYISIYTYESAAAAADCYGLYMIIIIIIICV